MAGIYWQGDRLIQKVKDKQIELGRIQLDESSGTYVLWLKDHNGVFTGNAASEVRGDEWTTLREAKENAFQTASIRLVQMSLKMSSQPRYGFLAMKFNNAELDRLASDHIKPTILEELNYAVKDLRDVTKAGVIDQIMLNEIRSAKFVIADLSHDNNGAYWEAGFAEGIGIPVIYICNKEKFESTGTHFDTNHHTTVLWSMGNVDKFMGKLIDTLQRSLKG